MFDFSATIGFVPLRAIGEQEVDDGSEAAHIALIDPHCLWAPGVLKLVAEENRLQRRGQPLRVRQAGDEGDGTWRAELVLAARSRLTAVIVGPLAPAALDLLLHRLCRAAQQAHWQCEHLLMLLPHGAVWMANKVDTVHWPAGLRVHCSDAVLNSASAAWQAVLTHWDVRLAAAARPHPRGCLAGLLGVDGLLACAVVDAASGAVLARETRDDTPADLDLDLAAAASSEALRAHRLAARAIGLGDAAVDEVMVSAGARLQLLHCPARRPGLFVFALLDRQGADVERARAGLVEAGALLSA